MFEELIGLWLAHKKDHGVESDGMLTPELFLDQVEEKEKTENYEKHSEYYMEGRRLYMRPSYQIIDNLIYMEGKLSFVHNFRILHYMACLDKKDPSLIHRRFDLEIYFMPQQGGFYLPYSLILESYKQDLSGAGLVIDIRRWEDLYATAID